MQLPKKYELHAWNAGASMAAVDYALGTGAADLCPVCGEPFYPDGDYPKKYCCIECGNKQNYTDWKERDAKRKES